MKKSKLRANAPKFLDPTAVADTIDTIRRVADAQGIDVALAGGCAMQLYGSDRFTKDVDVIASAFPTSGELRGREFLTFGGMRSRTKDGIEVDFIVRDDVYREMYESALAHAEVLGVKLHVVTRPFLVAMKMAAGRGKDEQDLEFLLIDSGMKRGDHDAARAVVVEFLGVYAAEELDSFKRLALWERRGRETTRPRRKR